MSTDLERHTDEELVDLHRASKNRCARYVVAGLALGLFDGLYLARRILYWTIIPPPVFTVPVFLVAAVLLAIGVAAAMRAGKVTEQIHARLRVALEGRVRADLARTR